jgi:hypothetical protein
MKELDDYIYERVVPCLEGLSQAERDDIYVVSLFVYDENGDPRRPTITVGFNTEGDVQAAPQETDQEEARWNYAFFRQNRLAILFDSDADAAGAEVRAAALSEAAHLSPEDDATATEVITPWFVANTVFAARRLHGGGDINRIFGRTIPVLVHELEYHDVIAMQNLAANPPGVADDFIRWCRGS